MCMKKFTAAVNSATLGATFSNAIIVHKYYSKATDIFGQKSERKKRQSSYVMMFSLCLNNNNNNKSQMKVCLSIHLKIQFCITTNQNHVHTIRQISCSIKPLEEHSQQTTKHLLKESKHTDKPKHNASMFGRSLLTSLNGSAFGAM